MVTVALAGATTGFGLTVLNIFIHLNKGEHKIVVLSRSNKPELASRGVDVRPVDYTNHEQLVKALQGVHTLISTVGGTPESALDAQLAMIKAAKEAGVKRWAPSEFAGVGYEGLNLYQPKAVVWEATQKSGLEYTRFECGLFMSVLATGTPKPVTEVGKREGIESGEEEALAGLRPWNFVLNVKAGTADFAGTGSQEMVLTDMRDVARFVWHSLSLEKWSPQSGMRGDVKTFRQLVQILEKVQRRKFLTQENSFEKLEEQAAKNPGLEFYNQARVALEKGWGMVGDDLNRAFPDVKPTTCEEFIEKWWGGVELGEPAWEQAKSFGADNL